MPKRSAARLSPFDGQMYLQGVYTVPARIPAEERFPYSLPFVRGLDLDLDRAVTFFVGENGTGKSTLLEAIADLCGFSLGGGGRDDVLDVQAAEPPSDLSRALRPRFRHRPRDGFFFRAETRFFGCGLGQLTGLFNSGVEVPDPHTGRSFGAVLGGRLGASLALPARFHVRFAADLLATLYSPQIGVDSKSYWKAPPVEGALGAGLVRTF
jgi:hypothetical protein